MSGQKIEEAKRAAHSTVANLPAGTEIAMQFFGTSGCDVEMVLDFTTDKAAADTAIDQAQGERKHAVGRGYRGGGSLHACERAQFRSGYHIAHGWRGHLQYGSCRGRPTHQHVDTAADYLDRREDPGSVAVRRGYWNFGRDVCWARLWASAAPAQAAPIRLHVIGFGIQAGSSTEQQLQQVAAAGGGRYFPAGDEAELTQALQQAATQPSVTPGDVDGDGLVH